ncbi:MAG: zf-HC2 domain-containing protein [Candidatus Omnitrophica bacterium]|nr:zf-HC2 domain-containing protein [Candidatus Omnitrophota bacterium]MBU4590630.1 zf-HC2 domain-containing protein [Candidatus Omnitrophota bacterium]
MRCLSEKQLSSYLDMDLAEEERRKIEAHVSECNHCLDLLLVAYDAQKYSHKCPKFLKDRIKNGLGLKQKKPRPDLKWLFGAVFLFALSFAFKKYFAQFLVAAAVLGVKWAMEGEAARRAIMIFKGIEKKEKKFERKSTPPMSDIAGGDRHGEGR